MSSLPPLYRSVIQTITAAERIGMTQGTASKPKMSPTNLIMFFTEEVQHCFINDECTKAAESALMAHGKNHSKSSGTRWKAILHQTLMCSVITVKGSDMLKLTAGLKEVGRKGKDLDTGNPRRSKSQMNLLLLQTVNQLMKICSCLLYLYLQLLNPC